MAAARLLGSGVYSILEHNNQTNLVYRLELPDKPGEAQAEFGIGRDGSYVLSIKVWVGSASQMLFPLSSDRAGRAWPHVQNPERSKGTRAAAPAPDPGLDEKADFPQEKRQEFAGYAWIPCHDSEVRFMRAAQLVHPAGRRSHC